MLALAHGEPSSSSVGSGGTPGARGPLTPALLLFLLERALVTLKMRGQRFAALLAAPSRSAGSRRSGFCAGGSSAAGCALGWRCLRHRREFHGRPGPLAAAGRRALLRSGGFVLAPNDGHFASRGAGADVFLAAHRAGQRTGATRSFRRRRPFPWRWHVAASVHSAGSGSVRQPVSAGFRTRGRSGRLRRDDDRHLARARRLGWAVAARAARLWSASALAVPPPFEELLDLLGFFLGQACQRRPFARDAGLRANIDQFLAVKFQLFR